MSCHSSSNDGPLERANGSHLHCCSTPDNAQATSSKCTGRTSLTDYPGRSEENRRRAVHPLHPALLAAIKATPAKGVTLIGDANGRPIQRATLTLIRKAVEAAGLPSRCVPHGLRKAIMRRLAESGSSARKSPRFPDTAH